MSIRESSQNFTYAKVIAILVVTIDHYFGQTILWVPSAIGLFVFAFSSGFFTAQRYRHPFPLQPYWHAKLVRLGPGLLVINLFLLVLFIAQGKSGIWNIQTPFAMLGLSEIGRWMGFQHTTPFGHGLWFFTVLILFYIAYPLIDKLISRGNFGSYFMTAILIATTILHYLASPGYMLWYVVFAFVFGVFVARRALQPPKTASMLVLAASSVILMGANVLFGFKAANYPLLLGIGISLVFVLMTWRLPKALFGWTGCFAGVITEIYFIHSYLFFSPAAWPLPAALAASLALILATALTLSWIERLPGRFLPESNKQHV